MTWFYKVKGVVSNVNREILRGGKNILQKKKCYDISKKKIILLKPFLSQ